MRERVYRIARQRLRTSLDPHSIRKYAFLFQLQPRTLPSLTEGERRLLKKYDPAFYRHLEASPEQWSLGQARWTQLQDALLVTLDTIQSHIQATVRQQREGLDTGSWERLKNQNVTVQDFGLLNPLTTDQLDLVIRLTLACAQDLSNHSSSATRQPATETSRR